MRSKIKCEHIGAIVTEEECLKCSLHDPPCPYTTAILKRFYQETREDEDPLEIVHVTDLLRCPRQSLWRKMHDYVEDVDTLYWRVRGTALHDVLERTHDNDKLLVEFPFEHTVRFKGRTFKLKGRIDEFNTETGILIDYKTTAEVPVYGAYSGHVTQIHFYAYFLRKLGYDVKKAYVVYLDMKRIAKHEVPVPTTTNIEAELKSRLLLYAENMQNPENAPNYELGPLCSYCPVEVMTRCLSKIFEHYKNENLTPEQLTEDVLKNTPVLQMKASMKTGKKRSYTRRKKKKEENN